MQHIATKIQALGTKPIILCFIGGVVAIGGAASVAAVLITNSPQEIAEVPTTRQAEVVETEEIDFTTIEKEDDSKNEGTTEVAQEGKKGQRSIKYLVTYDSDDNEIVREKIAEEVTEPIDKIVVKGTKKIVASTQQSSTPTNGQSQSDPCATKLAGWGRPTNCPRAQTRAEFTALGGWEKLVEAFYISHKDMEPMERCDGTTCVYERSGTMSGLCYGSISVDMDTLVVLSVRWDNQPTSTCDAVRNEYPPLPSTDYLTQYLRSLAK